MGLGFGWTRTDGESNVAPRSRQGHRARDSKRARTRRATKHILRVPLAKPDAKLRIHQQRAPGLTEEREICEDGTNGEDKVAGPEEEGAVAGDVRLEVALVGDDGAVQEREAQHPARKVPDQARQERRRGRVLEVLVACERVRLETDQRGCIGSDGGGAGAAEGEGTDS